MSLIDAVIAHLKTSVPSLKKVSGAVDFASAGTDLKNSTPAAYVLPLADKAGQNELCNAVSQRVDVRFGVVLAVQNLRDARGQNAHSDLEPIRRAVIDALLGWNPDADHAPVLYGGGRLLQLADGVLWWQLEFVTVYYERKI